MDLLVLNQAEVRQFLPMAECIEAMARALAALARGQVRQPLRMVLHTPDHSGLLAMMPAYLDDCIQPTFGFKAVTVYPGNAARQLETHHAAVMLLEPDTGRTLALMDGAAITAIRTAAVSGVATRALANPNAKSLAILGAGVQALTHLEAICCVRPIQQVSVWSRTFVHAQQFAESNSGRFGSTVEAVDSVQAALQGAEIVVTATAATAPILQRAWLAAGAHINAVGAALPNARELDSDTVAVG